MWLWLWLWSRCLLWIFGQLLWRAILWIPRRWRGVCTRCGGWLNEGGYNCCEVYYCSRCKHVFGDILDYRPRRRR